MYLNDLFNTRELTTVFWAIVVLSCALLIPGVRRTISPVIRTALQGKLVGVVIAMLAYVAGVVFCLHRVGVWSIGLLKDTVFWSLGAAVVAVFGVLQSEADQDYLRKLLLNSAGLIVVLQFLTNTYTYPLVVEILAIPALTFIAMLQAVAERDPKSALVNKVLSWMMAFYGLVAVGISVLRVLRQPSRFLTLPNLASFLLPIVLTVALVPFIYSFGLLAEYESNFIRLQWWVPDARLRRYAKFKTLLRFHVNLWALKRWTRKGGLGPARSREEVRERLRNATHRAA